MDYLLISHSIVHMMTKYLISIITIFALLSCSKDNDEISYSDLSKNTPSSGVVYGVVFDNNSEMPLAGVSVSIYPSGKKIITGSDGQYEFYDLSDNNYIIQAMHADYISTVDVIKLRGEMRQKNDIRMIRGQTSLAVDEHVINVSDVDSHHSLLITNISNKTVKWNISYDDIFDPATGSVYIYLTEWDGELQPYETKEIFVNLTVSATLDNNFAFPLILQSGLEKIGITIVPYGDNEKMFSKITGKWNLYRSGHYEDGIQVYEYFPSSSQVLLLKSNLEYELFNNNVYIWFDSEGQNVDVDDIWDITYKSGSYTYIPSENILFLGETFSEGYYAKVLNVTDYELILGSLDFDQDKKEGWINFYTKEN